MAYEKLVAFYDKTEKARRAANALESSGFASSDIRVLERESFSDKDAREGSVWQLVFGRIVSDQESAGFRRTIDSGGAVLTLRVPDTDVNRAVKILDVHGPINQQDRSSTQASTPSPAATGRTERGDEVFSLAEEQMAVSKRQVETGKSRIHRFVTENPVEQQVTLHDERYEVSRREPTDPKLAGDIDWKDQTIELVETSEQPVVTKTARIAEEVVIRRQGSDHVETVRDTVRRQEIEVERAPDVKKAA